MAFRRRVGSGRVGCASRERGNSSMNCTKVVGDFGAKYRQFALPTSRAVEQVSVLGDRVRALDLLKPHQGLA